MKKALFVATVVKTHINVFHLPYLKTLQDMGFETSVCAKNDFENKSDCVIPYCDNYYDFQFERSPFKLKNFKIIKALKHLINEERYNIIHCHTPVGGVITRIAARKARKKYGTKVMYTAHGFHFYKGAPLLNWLVYYPIEWICSFFTDVLITINQEDYEFAKAKMRLKKGGKVYYVPGVGIDAERISNTAFGCDAKRRELGIMPGKIALLSVGELNDNKNHETVIRAISRLHNNENIIYIICGKGDKEKYLKNLADELGVNLVLAGFRGDVVEICKACDIFVFPSKREGLSVSLMEAMAAGLPCVVSEIRGNVDLVKQKRNGFLCKPSDVEGFAESIKVLVTDEELRKKMSQNNLEDIKNFDIVNVVDKMTEIYRELM